MLLVCVHNSCLWYIFSIDPSKTGLPYLLLLCPMLSHHTPCSHHVHHEKYLVEQRENWQRTHRQDRAWLLLLWNMVSAFKFCHFVRNSSNTCCFVALLFVLIDHCSASVQAACEPIISTSILIIKRNKHEWTSEGLLFKPLKDINTHHFSSSSPLTLIYSPVWFVCRTKWQIQRYDWLDPLPIKLPTKGQLTCLFFAYILFVVILFDPF